MAFHTLDPQFKKFTLDEVFTFFAKLFSWEEGEFDVCLLTYRDGSFSYMIDYPTDILEEDFHHLENDVLGNLHDSGDL